MYSGIPSDIAGHTFEIVKLYKTDQEWLAQFAVDNVLYPEFLEPCSNVHDMKHDDFIHYMKSQALSMAEYCRTRGMVGGRA